MKKSKQTKAPLAPSPGPDKIPIPEAECPVCRYRVDVARIVEGKQFKANPGDMSLCARYGELLVFEPDMTLRIPTLTELIELPAEASRLIDKVQYEIRSARMIPFDK